MAENFPEDVEIFIHESIVWLKTASDDKKKLLAKYLLDLDKSKRVDLTTERSQRVVQGVREIMTKVCIKIKEKDPRLTGNLISMGSAHNHTKTGELNEFDYTYELDTHVLLKGRGKFKRYLKDITGKKVVVHFDTDDDYENCKDFTKTSRKSNSASSSSGENTEQNITLNFEHIHRIFRDILLKALPEIELPPGWCHGGFNRPEFSGVRFNGKACLLQFDYLETDEAPLRLSVDFVPMIRIPIDKGYDDATKMLEDAVKKSSLEMLIQEKIDVTCCWVSIQNGDLSYSNAEKEWLSKYSSVSMPKTVMRIGKELGVLVNMNYERLILKEDYSAINRLKENNKICSLNLPSSKSEFLLKTDDYVTYSNVGETVGDKCLVKSYFIKRLVMYMMSDESHDESHGHEWTESDLPDLVICVYMTLTDAIDKQRKSDYQYKQVQLSVPLVGTSVIADGPKCPVNPESSRRPFNLKDTLAYLETKTHARNDILRAFKSYNSQLLLSRMSAVFQLFTKVCQGHTTAEIVTYNPVIPREHRLRELYQPVTGSELFIRSRPSKRRHSANHNPVGEDTGAAQALEVLKLRKPIAAIKLI